jgi:SSS family solute:Na+ symporter
MSALDFVVLIGSILGIAGYGVWRTRRCHDLQTYLKGEQNMSWVTIGLSVMATQASAITFMSTPGQGYQDGLGFVQFYLGIPIALVIIAAVFLPMFRRLNVYTAYEFLGRRFDAKTRLFGAALFLLQRGLAAGITIYAPAIILSAMLGWSLTLTILLSGLVAIIYTTVGGTEAVSLTQQYQMAVIFGGMVLALIILLLKIPASLGDTFAVAGAFNKLHAVDFSPDVHKRYTIWSGLLGGLFLQMSYFGADQSQVQRYIAGSSLRQSRLGLMFNAVCKIPMQFSILLLGALVFVFYQFQPSPLLFNKPAVEAAAQGSAAAPLQALQTQYSQLHARQTQQIQAWLTARHAGDRATATAARAQALATYEQAQQVRHQAETTIVDAHTGVKGQESDYVFITFILHHLPHGVIGLLIAAFFAAALSSKAAELNALASTSTVDFYKFLIRRDATGRHYVVASKAFTVFWGMVALAFALFASLQDNLIQAVNIIGSLFYGVQLALFLVAFFFKQVGGTAVFWSALVAEAMVLGLHFGFPNLGYLWYNPIGCVACILLSLALQATLGRNDSQPQPVPVASAPVH